MSKQKKQTYNAVAELNDMLTEFDVEHGKNYKVHENQ